MKSTKEKLYEIVFEADTPLGKAFDFTIIGLIIISIIMVMLDSIPRFHNEYSSLIKIVEWIITICFTIEYILRIKIVRKPAKYIFSFYGIIDLLSILPSFVELFVVGAQGLLVIRGLRLLRIFRILKLSRYTKESVMLAEALKSSRIKIFIFLFTVATLVIIIGTVMYLVEGEKNGFSNIPISVYWAVVTLTTVGYGDISPSTPIGQFLASIVMILGYAIIAVPTGIVSVEFAKSSPKKVSTQVCPDCLKEGHEPNATFCKFCGSQLNDTQ